MSQSRPTLDERLNQMLVHGALSHTRYALHGALLPADRRAVEVHVSDRTRREPWRSVSETTPATRHQVIGHGSRGYPEALDWLLDGAGTG